MTRVVLEAHAKINLNLKVVGRRPDGYHNLDTVLQTVTLYDSLILEPAERTIRLEMDDPSLPAGEDNLVWRAAEALSMATGQPDRGARIILQKRIPIGAGLGGGSSDAAATLVGLSRLWGLDLSAKSLASVAAAVGSDIPFFLTGGTARLGGRGTAVYPLPDPPSFSLVIVYPGVPISTREVYEQVQAPLTPAAETVTMTRSGADPAVSVEGWVRSGNDLESIARRLCPAIGEMEDRLLEAGAGVAAMTGSGSAVFGVFGSPAVAERAVAALQGHGWRVLPCRSLGRAGHLRGLGLA